MNNTKIYDVTVTEDTEIENGISFIKILSRQYRVVVSTTKNTSTGKTIVNNAKLTDCTNGKIITLSQAQYSEFEKSPFLDFG